MWLQSDDEEREVRGSPGDHAWASSRCTGTATSLPSWAMAPYVGGQAGSQPRQF